MAKNDPKARKPQPEDRDPVRDEPRLQANDSEAFEADEDSDDESAEEAARPDLGLPKGKRQPAADDATPGEEQAMRRSRPPASAYPDEE